MMVISVPDPAQWTRHGRQWHMFLFWTDYSSWSIAWLSPSWQLCSPVSSCSNHFEYKYCSSRKFVRIWVTLPLIWLYLALDLLNTKQFLSVVSPIDIPIVSVDKLQEIKYSFQLVKYCFRISLAKLMIDNSCVIEPLWEYDFAQN